MPASVRTGHNDLPRLVPLSGDVVPHRIIIAPLAAIYALLTALCGIEATAIVLAVAGAFAVLAYAFVPPVRARTDTHVAGSRHHG
jgi:hypothetical protein